MSERPQPINQNVKIDICFACHTPYPHRSYRIGQRKWQQAKIEDKLHDMIGAEKTKEILDSLPNVFRFICQSCLGKLQAFSKFKEDFIMYTECLKDFPVDKLESLEKGDIPQPLNINELKEQSRSSPETDSTTANDKGVENVGSPVKHVERMELPKVPITSTSTVAKYLLTGYCTSNIGPDDLPHVYSFSTEDDFATSDLKYCCFSCGTTKAETLISLAADSPYTQYGWIIKHVLHTVVPANLQMCSKCVDRLFEVHAWKLWVVWKLAKESSANKELAKLSPVVMPKHYFGTPKRKFLIRLTSEWRWVIKYLEPFKYYPPKDKEKMRLKAKKMKKKGSASTSGIVKKEKKESKKEPTKEKAEEKSKSLGKMDVLEVQVLPSGSQNVILHSLQIQKEVEIRTTPTSPEPRRHSGADENRPSEEESPTKESDEIQNSVMEYTDLETELPTIEAFADVDLSSEPKPKRTKTGCEYMYEPSDKKQKSESLKETPENEMSMNKESSQASSDKKGTNDTKISCRKKKIVSKSKLRALLTEAEKDIECVAEEVTDHDYMSCQGTYDHTYAAVNSVQEVVTNYMQSSGAVKMEPGPLRNTLITLSRQIETVASVTKSESVSVLRCHDFHDLCDKEFIARIIKELKECIPFLFEVLYHLCCPMHGRPPDAERTIALIYAMGMYCRSRQHNLLQRMLSMCIPRTSINRETFDILNAFGITLSYTMAGNVINKYGGKEEVGLIKNNIVRNTKYQKTKP